MSAVRLLRSDSIFVADEWRAVTMVSSWRGIGLVGHGWTMTLAVAALASWAAHPLAWLAAVALIGGRQLGLAILMHEAAHGLLHPNRKLNNFLGQWLTGAAVGSDLQAYRAYHLRHHRYTQQPEDPDLKLSAPFPASRASLLRKIFRDLSGQTFLKQRIAQFSYAFIGLRAIIAGKSGGKPVASSSGTGTAFNRQLSSGVSAPTVDVAGAIAVAHAVMRFLIVQAVLLALSLALYGWTPFLLWLAGLATSFQLFLRIRNIAEHACTATGSDDPFSHARTTHANMLERATVAPYWVNYHAEHHLFMGVPCYRLAAVHQLLGARGYHPRMTIATGYADVLRRATAIPSV